MNVYAYDVGWKTADNVPDRYQYGQPNYSVFEGDNTNPDFSTLNIGFFQHLDRVIQHLNEKGIVAHLMIYVWNKKVNWPSMYSQADNRYFDYIIKRYQAFPNIIWDVSKEALDYGRCDIPYINERIQRIRKLDACQRLVTVHDYEYCYREPDRVDFISIQNWRNDLYSLSLEALLRHADKPVMNIEDGGYEEGPYLSFQGNYIEPETCLVRNYECIFAGLYSTYYWQNTSWNIIIHDPMHPEHDFSQPRFDYYQHLQSLFQRYDYNTLYFNGNKLRIMNFDHIVSDGTGLIHLISSILALLAGTIVLISTKGTKYHKQLGYVYTIFMAIVLVTSFLMYNLYGRFGIFHYLAAVSTITLIGGILPMYIKRPSSYITMHFSFMYWSVLGLYGAFIAEILVRIPKAVVQKGIIDPMFYNLIGLAVFIIMGTGYFFFGKKKKEWAKLDKAIIDGGGQ